MYVDPKISKIILQIFGTVCLSGFTSRKKHEKPAALFVIESSKNQKSTCTRSEFESLIYDGFAHYGLLVDQNKPCLCSPPTCRNSTFIGGKFIELYKAQKILPAKLCRSYRVNTRAFASRKSIKKLKGDRQPLKTVADSPPTNVQEDNMVHSFENSAAQNFSIIPSRGAVLQACTVTSGLIAALGIIIRKVSHVASVEGLLILDCTAEVSCAATIFRGRELLFGLYFCFILIHHPLSNGTVGLLTPNANLRLVVIISSCRYLLLKTWPDFAVSSDAANRQVLSSLQLSDYIIVAFLPGISEELLFHGALLPLFGLDWKSVWLVAALFGVLHLGNGLKACFVGLVYGYATIISSSIIVPVASHAANNLVGGILWRYTSNSSQKS